MLTNSVKQTVSLGQRIASQLKPGAVLGLIGELGSGKTQFTKGLAKGLKINQNITSPTFVLLKQYPLSQGNFIHIDCYRLSNPQELLDLGWQELINNPQNIIAVEWADKIKLIMPKHTHWIKFKTGQKENQRILTL